MSTFSDVLSASDLNEEVVDALERRFLPLLKNASTEDVSVLLFLSRRLLKHRRDGNDQAALSTMNKIKLLAENTTIEFRHDSKDFLSDLLMAIVGGIPRAVISVATGGLVGGTP